MDNLRESATDTIMAWLIFRKLLRKAKDTEAFKLGLIDKNFKILHKPKTRAEKKAMSLLDKLIFRIQNLLGSKLSLIAYTGLMISSVDTATENGYLLTNKELGDEINLEHMADDIATQILETKTLSKIDREFVLNQVVEKLLSEV